MFRIVDIVRSLKVVAADDDDSFVVKDSNLI